MHSPTLAFMDPTLRPNRWAEALRAMADLDYRIARMEQPTSRTEPNTQPYLVQSGVAIVPIYGPLSKDAFVEWFGGTSSVMAEDRIRLAAMDPQVGSIMLRIDSPGGDVAGTEELGGAVWEARKSGVPVHAHIEDLGASAAYWVASQADRITANSTAEVGSIGTMVMFPDTSKMWEDVGVKWHVVSTGPYKGLLAKPEVTEEALAYLQERIDPMTEEFKKAISRGRGQSMKWAGSVASGRTWGAGQAEGIGLIDAVATKTAAFVSAVKAAKPVLEGKASERRSRIGRRALAAVRNRRETLARLAAERARIKSS